MNPTDIEIEHVARAEVTATATVGDLRTALNDARLPDAAEVVWAEISHVDVPADNDYTLESLTSGVPLSEHRHVVTLNLEWEL